jgi:NADH-quinone oxidoreductase subunit I
LKKGANSSYFAAIKEAWVSSLIGIMLTWKHFSRAITKIRRKPLNVSDKNYFHSNNGIETLKYPYESIPVPDNGRYKLHNEIEDCIVCDKCAKVCPVDCIEIEALKSPEIIGYTSDGTAKRLYAATFNIDMAKCCFCGLCTTVCPTECLTMTNEYDFSVYDVTKMNFPFSNLSAEQVEEKKKALEVLQEAKKAGQIAIQKQETAPVSPQISQSAADTTTSLNNTENPENQATKTAKPVFKPKIKTPTAPKNGISEENLTNTAQKTTDQTTKPSAADNTQSTNNIVQENKSSLPENTPAKPLFRPKVKPSIPIKKETDIIQEESLTENSLLTNSPTNEGAVTTIAEQPATKTDIANAVEDTQKNTTNKTDKPVFRPKVKPLINKPIIKDNNGEENERQ